MELHHLRYFLELADSLSFSSAAERLGITQPALSRQIRDLERDLGAPLFNREGRRNSLTVAGSAFLPAARAAVTEAERARREVREVLGAQGGRLVVGSSPQTAASVLAPVVQRFTRAYPRVELRMREDGALALVEGLEYGDLDLAVVPLDVPHTLVVRPFLTARIMAIAPKDHWLMSESMVELRALVASFGQEPIPLLLLKEQYLTRVRLAAAWHEAGLMPHVAMESAVGQTLAAYAEAGLGVAILPETVDLRGFNLGGAVVCDGGEPILLKNGIGWNPRRYLSPAAAEFIELATTQSSPLIKGAVVRPEA
jgi:DNA-binding transcriptional LysR family regulator